MFHQTHYHLKVSSIVMLAFLFVLVGGVAATGKMPPSHQAMPDEITSADAENCSGYPEHRVPLESQVWWWRRLPTQTGTDFGHIHVFTCFPSRQTVSGIVELDLKILFHDNPSVLKRVHVQGWPETDVDNVGTGCEQITGNLWCANKLNLACPSGDCVWSFKAQIDTTRFKTDGLKEFRIRATADTPDAATMSNSTSWFMNVQNGKGSTSDTTYAGGKVLASRGWYTCHGYALTEIYLNGEPPNPVPPLWSVRMVAKPGSKADCTHVDDIAHHLVTIDPDFHGGNQGIVVRKADGKLDSTINIDTTQLANGWHKLVLRADADTEDDSTNSAVQVVWFNVQNSAPNPPTATPAPTATATAPPTSVPTATTTANPTATPPATDAPPTVSITSPANNAIVTRGSTVTITAAAADDKGVTKVEFLVNGKVICTDSTSPYSCSWKVPAKPNVTYTVQAKAYDAAGNTALSTISVTAK